MFFGSAISTFEADIRSSQKGKAPPKGRGFFLMSKLRERPFVRDRETPKGITVPF